MCAKCSALLTRQSPEPDRSNTTLPQVLTVQPEEPPPPVRPATQDTGPLATDEVALYVGQSDKPLVIEIASQAVTASYRSGTLQCLWQGRLSDARHHPPY
jgi:hypothetical protein